MSNLFSLFDGGLTGFPRGPRLFDDFERLFGDFDSLYQQRAAERSPTIETRATESGYEVSAALPGATQDDIKVDVHNGILTISGERNVAVPEGYRVSRRERASVKFTRSIHLPDNVDDTAIQAEMKDGLLRITLPKRPEVEPRQIPIRAH